MSSRYALPLSARRSLPRGVYRVSDGVYRARVKHGRRLRSLGRFDNPKDAAKAVRDWYESVYGEDWEAAYKRRLAPTWSVVRRPELQVYQLRVWVMGIEETIIPRKQDGFETAEEARAYFRKWVHETFGMFGSLSLWRTDG